MSNASSTNLAKSYLEPLIAGDRAATRQVVEQALSVGIAPRDLLNQLIWPTMELLQSLYRDDRLTVTQLNLATRLNRALTDQICAKLERNPANDKKVLIFCGDDEPEELGGQICSDLFDADGWTVKFAGGGVPEDEVLNLIGSFRPRSGRHVRHPTQRRPRGAQADRLSPRSEQLPGNAGDVLRRNLQAGRRLGRRNRRRSLCTGWRRSR